MPETPEQQPPKRTVQMYDRPASADRPPLGRVVVIVIALLLAVLLVAKFAFHVHFGHLLHTG